MVDSVFAGVCGESGPSATRLNLFFALDDVKRAVGSTTLSGTLMKEFRRSYRYCGRDFSGAELAKIRQIIASDDLPNRATISRRVCKAFDWYKQDGGLK